MAQMGVSVGFKIHTGWAAFVAVTREPDRLDVLLHGRAELLPGDDSIPRFVYHEAATLDAAGASDVVRRAERASQKLAEAAVRNMLADLRSGGVAPGACGVITGSTKLKPETDLATILRAHPLIHAAEGALFQNAIVNACGQCGLVVTTVRERDVWNAAAKACDCDVLALRKQIDGLRKIVAAPWTTDEKIAAAAALAAQMRPQLT
jgi:hypothetical protein